MLVGEELFAVEVETGVEREFVAAGAEGNGLGEFPSADDTAGDGLVRRVWNEDASTGVGSESFQAECDAGCGDGVAFFIEDSDALASGGALGKGDELALADERAGGHLAAGEIDEPRARTC